MKTAPFGAVVRKRLRESSASTKKIFIDRLVPGEKLKDTPMNHSVNSALDSKAVSA